MALVAAHQEGYVTNNRLQQLIDNHSLHSNKVLAGLVDKGYLDSQGIGKGTKYLLGETFKDINAIEDIKIEQDIKSNEFSIDEMKIIEIIKNNGFITNRISRENLGFGKSKSLNIFNKLIDENKIEKVGSGSSTKYVLKSE